MTMTKTMFLEIGRKRFQVASSEEASRMFCAARDRMGEGSSRTPSPKIVDERGDVIGHVSYNGRVWAGASYVADNDSGCKFDIVVSSARCRSE